MCIQAYRQVSCLHCSCTLFLKGVRDVGHGRCCFLWLGFSNSLMQFYSDVSVERWVVSPGVLQRACVTVPMLQVSRFKPVPQLQRRRTRMVISQVQGLNCSKLQQSQSCDLHNAIAPKGSKFSVEGFPS